MKAILKFNLEDPEEKRAHLRCVKALDLALATYDFINLLNKIREKEDAMNKDMTAKQIKIFIDRRINEIIEDYSINIHELVN
jgi:hypothetical protein